MGAVTQLIPPNYGIVDGNAFYVEPVVEGKLPAVGDRVNCQGIPNTDGGMYEWRLLRVEVCCHLHAPTSPCLASHLVAHKPEAFICTVALYGLFLGLSTKIFILPLQLCSLETDHQMPNEWLPLFAAGAATGGHPCAVSKSDAAEQALRHPAQPPAGRWQSARLASSDLPDVQPCLPGLACCKAPF